MQLSARVIRGWYVLAGVPALFLAAYIWPTLAVSRRVPLCAVKMFTGLSCPGCGLRSSISFLAHGNIRGSIHAHPMGVVIAAWLVYMMARQALALLIGRPVPELLRQRQRDMLLWVFLVGLMTHWIARLAISHICT